MTDNINDEDAYARVQKLFGDGVQPDRITEWEWDFLESVMEQIKQGRYMSEKQLEIIERIEQKASGHNPRRR